MINLKSFFKLFVFISFLFSILMINNGCFDKKDDNVSDKVDNVTYSDVANVSIQIKNQWACKFEITVIGNYGQANLGIIDSGTTNRWDDVKLKLGKEYQVFAEGIDSCKGTLATSKKFIASDNILVKYEIQLEANDI